MSNLYILTISKPDLSRYIIPAERTNDLSMIAFAGLGIAITMLILLVTLLVVSLLKGRLAGGSFTYFLLILLGAGGFFLDYYFGEKNEEQLTISKEIALSQYLDGIADSEEEIQAWLFDQKPFLQSPQHTGEQYFNEIFADYFEAGYDFTHEEEIKMYTFISEMFFDDYIQEVKNGDTSRFDEWRMSVGGEDVEALEEEEEDDEETTDFDALEDDEEDEEEDEEEDAGDHFSEDEINDAIGADEED